MLSSELLKRYELAKKRKLEICEEHVERIKKQKSESAIKSELKSAICYTSKKYHELMGMLELLESAHVLKQEECETEKEEIKELFSSKRLYGAEIMFSTGKLKLYVTEIKKEV